MDVEGFVDPRCSASSGRSQVPPKPIASERQKQVEDNLVPSNQYSALSDYEMDSSAFLSN